MQKTYILPNWCFMSNKKSSNRCVHVVIITVGQVKGHRDQSDVVVKKKIDVWLDIAFRPLEEIKQNEHFQISYILHKHSFWKRTSITIND